MLEIDVEKYLRLAEDSYVNKLGKVVLIVGLTIESVGPDANLGDVCRIISRDNPEYFVNAEVVGFRDKRVLLMPFDNIDGIGPGSIVENTGRPLLVKVSDNLLGKTLEKPLVQTLERLTSDKKRTAYLADVTSEITGLEYFPQYLTLLFELDSLILNDDRHLNNIAVIEKNGKYDYCPIFDNGAGLLSNTQIYRMDIQTKALIHTVRSRPFNTTFNRQLSTVRELYHPQFKIAKVTRAEIAEILSPLLVYYSERDQSIISDRVISCILERQKYV
jgi:hypothetical protein